VPGVLAAVTGPVVERRGVLKWRHPDGEVLHVDIMEFSKP